MVCKSLYTCIESYNIFLGPVTTYSTVPPSSPSKVMLASLPISPVIFILFPGKIVAMYSLFWEGQIWSTMQRSGVIYLCYGYLGFWVDHICGGWESHIFKLLSALTLTWQVKWTFAATNLRTTFCSVFSMISSSGWQICSKLKLQKLRSLNVNAFPVQERSSSKQEIWLIYKIPMDLNKIEIVKNGENKLSNLPHQHPQC